MIVRPAAAVFIPLGLYIVRRRGRIFRLPCSAGDRGIGPSMSLKQKRDSQRHSPRSKAERADWEHRVAMLRAETSIRDMLDERARIAAQSHPPQRRRDHHGPLMRQAISAVQLRLA